jgi:heme exporter protein D
MQFSSFSEFIAMGGYGFYVWLSVATTALLLIGLILSSISQRKQLIHSLKQKQLRDQKLKQVAQKINQQPVEK